jgi:hypothetical protein
MAAKSMGPFGQCPQNEGEEVGQNGHPDDPVARAGFMSDGRAISEDAYQGDAQFTVSVDGMRNQHIFAALSSPAARAHRYSESAPGAGWAQLATRH